MNLNKTTITIAILIGLVLIFGMLWGVELYRDYRIDKNWEIYYQGAEDVTQEIISLSVECKPIKIQLGENKTLTLIAIGCLNQGVGK